MQRARPFLPRGAFRAVLAVTLPLAAAVVLGACAAPEPPVASPLPGSDRDAHGCLPSAGYQWCPRAGSCQRPWDLANRVGFAPESFAGYCGIGRQ